MVMMMYCKLKIDTNTQWITLWFISYMEMGSSSDNIIYTIMYVQNCVSASISLFQFLFSLFLCIWAKKKQQKMVPIWMKPPSFAFCQLFPLRLCVCDASQKSGVVFSSPLFLDPPSLSSLLHLHTLHFNLISKHYRRAKQHTFESRRWHRCKLLTNM